MATRSSLVEVRACAGGAGVLCAQMCVAAGKSMREGMGQATDRTAEECLDLVITNALVIDWSGIYKVTVALLFLRAAHTQA
jgi:urease alpha subunit